MRNTQSAQHYLITVMALGTTFPCRRYRNDRKASSLESALSALSAVISGCGHM